MSDSITLNVTRDFSETPGAGLRSDGNHSGQEFLEDFLEPRFIEARESGKPLVVELDGTYGYPPSFLWNSFGRLSARYGWGRTNETLRLQSKDPELIQEVTEYLRKGEDCYATERV